MERDQAVRLTQNLLKKMVENNGSDLFITADFPPAIKIDGTPWFDGEASCVLLGNVGKITGGIPAFDDARPDDGWLEVGVATAAGAMQWARTLGRMAVGRSEKSPFVRITRARKVRITLASPTMYELDGGARDLVTKVKAKVVPGALTVCVPEDREPAAAPKLPA